MTGWSASGLYAQALAQTLAAGANAPQWNNTANKFYLTSNSDTPAYNASLASSVYASGAPEIYGTGWAAGGIAVSALATGSTTLAPSFTYATAPPTVLQWAANNVSVATTTIAGAYGGYFYSSTASYLYKIIGIYFGGSGYSTTAGTFAITWSGGLIATITCSTST